LEQVPDHKSAWAAKEGATNAGAVTFEDVGGGQTRVNLILEYEPEGLIEKVGDKLNIVENQAEADLERFKAFIESERYATGAWRGSVNEDAAVGTRLWMTLPPRGDTGKAGVSGKVVAAKGSEDDDTIETDTLDVGAPLAAAPEPATVMPADVDTPPGTGPTTDAYRNVADVPLEERTPVDGGMNEPERG
jgi:hypothetical protein